MPIAFYAFCFLQTTFVCTVLAERALNRLTPTCPHREHPRTTEARRWAQAGAGTGFRARTGPTPVPRCTTAQEAHLLKFKSYYDLKP